LTRPFVYCSANSLNLLAPLPFGVSGATTWLNLMLIGACPSAPAEASARATPATIDFNIVLMCLLPVAIRSPRAVPSALSGRQECPRRRGEVMVRFIYCRGKFIVRNRTDGRFCYRPHK